MKIESHLSRGETDTETILGISETTGKNAPIGSPLVSRLVLSR